MNKKAIVIGSGIAGATTALALRRLGVDVVVIEKLSMLEFLSNSSNAICNMHPRFDAEFNKYTYFYLDAYLCALDFYNNYPDHFVKSGMKIFPHKNNIAKLKTIADILGSEILRMNECNIQGEYLHLIKSGYLYIKNLCNFILKDFQVLHNQEIVQIKYRRGDVWSVLNDSSEEIEFADYVIFANSNNAVKFFPYLTPHLHFIRGQSTAIDADIALEGQEILCLPFVSILRDKAGILNFGSTYKRGNLSMELEKNCQIKNVENLLRYFKTDEDLHAKPLSGYVGVRTVPIDYLPIVGEIQGMKGVYVNIGHGSRGVTSAPICANIIADLINGSEKSKLLNFLSPTRFIKPKNARFLIKN